MSLELGAFIGGLLVARATTSTQRKFSLSREHHPQISQAMRLNTKADKLIHDTTASDFEGTPSKPECFIEGDSTSHREQGDLFAHGNSRVVVRIVSPLRNFFSFLYYATAGMALNPQFMIHNIYIICSFALLTSFLKATSFAVALKAFGASKQNAIA